MKRLATNAAFLTVLTVLACTSNNRGGKAHTATVVVTPNKAAILKDFESWWTYISGKIHLERDFIPLDEDSTRISKATFLNKLAGGNYVPFEVLIKDDSSVYKIERPQKIDSQISENTIQLAYTHIKNYNWEGKELPGYRFTDLNGTTYTPENTKGKIILLKCWFIHCVACVAEFPELNRLVEKYQGRKDVLFISLATDSKDSLYDFLNTHSFKYATAPQQHDYIRRELQVLSYPTHFLIDRAGRVVKVTQEAKEIIPFFEKEIEKTGNGS
ncbi:MAG: TlpA family protein disulfide reductase [Niabella sp.]|nr:TlpA family protein disulfide reductase [Niabella sp.]